MCLLVFLSNNLYAQFTSQAFFEGYGTRGLQEMFYKSSVIQSSNGYTYMCGASINTSGDYDMLLTKFDSQQQEVWSVTYAGLTGGDDYAADLIEDANGNIFITGAEYISATNYDAVTIKYNSQGVQQWVKTYDGVGLYDGGVSLALDAVDNVYICGGSYEGANLSDFLVVKYTNGGAQQWANTWNGTNNLQDVAARIEIRGAYLSAVGGTQTTQNKWKMATLKMSISSGQIAATTISGGDASGIDKVADLAIDDLDNTYIVGAVKNNGSAYDIRVIKLDSDLSIVWQQDYDGGSNEDDEGLSLELTSTNDVIICGFTTQTGEGKNFVTQKYANANGALLWTSTYDNQNGDDEAVTVKVTDNDDVIVFGSTYQDGNLDFALQSLRGINGNTKWETTWNGGNNADDVPSEIAIDGDDIYAAGQSYDGDGLYQYVITKWNMKEYAATKPDGRKTPNGFIENRGQLQNNDGTTNNDIDYYIPSQWPGTYVSDDKVSYVWSKRDTIGPDTTTYHRIDMAFKKGNSSAKVYPTEKLDHYTNIYLGYLPNKLERTAHYSSVTKIEAYTNTDIIYTSHSQGYRHHIVAKQGAPTADFEMEYDGYDSMTIDANGNLVFGTTFGDHVQSKAKVYNMNPSTGELYELSWQPDYVITGNKVSFSFPQTWTGTLVIEIEKEQAMAAGGGGLADPGNIDWSTYYGKLGNERIMASDAALNFYYTAGNADVELFPINDGFEAVSCENCGLYDLATLQCFTISDCNNRYSILFGGNWRDSFGSIVARENGEIFVSGFGSTNLQNQAELYTEEFVGRYNEDSMPDPSQAFYTYLTSFIGPTGFIQWSTYITSTDVYNPNPSLPLAFNSDDELYFCGFGLNNSGPIGLGGGFQWTANSPSLNGFVIRFDSNYQPLWSTEFGRSLRVNDAVVTDDKDIVITGYMNSDALPDFDEFSTDGQETFPYGGGDDGYLIVFDANNALDWFTWLGGSGGDRINCVETYNNSIFLGGSTSSSNFPFEQTATPGQYFESNSPSNDAFFTQFDEDQMVWSTLLTNEGNSSINDIKATSVNELYLAGTITSSFMPTFNLPNAYNEDLLNSGLPSSSSDAFLWRFNDKVPEWNTFIGGNNWEGGTTLTLVNDQYVYLAASSGSDLLFPWWEYNENSVDDYFDDELDTEISNSDMYITRFNLDLIDLSIDWFDLTKNHNLHIFPNPALDYIYISIPENELIKEVCIYNAEGKLVLLKTNLFSNDNIEVNTSVLKNGVYSIVTESDDNTYFGKIVKLN
ncbi:MAG: T9SS type A sorting domain-containing protein [Flavobacteriales bacterium]